MSAHAEAPNGIAIEQDSQVRRSRITSDEQGEIVMSAGPSIHLMRRFRNASAVTVLGLTLLAPPSLSSTFCPETGVQLAPAAVSELLAKAVDGKIYIDDMVFDVESVQSGFGGAAWTNGVVYYSFDASVTASNRQRWLDAAHQWEISANIRFQARAGEANWIQIHNGTANTADVGMRGGQQNMNIASWGVTYVIVHEIGHALGLWHEHQRPDRGGYVAILAGNIQAGQEHNFDVISPLTTYGAYDFESVMHYSACSFSTDCPPGANCSCVHPTIQSLPAYAQWQSLMGQRDSLSVRDRAGMASRYGIGPCSPPTLSTPGSGASCVATVGVLGWSAVPGATSYRVQVIKSGASWSAPLVDQTVTSNSFAYSGLLASSPYEWRVKSMTTSCSDGLFSGARVFTTAPAVEPQVPTPVSPAAFQACVSVAGKLKWRAIPGAAGYEVLLKLGASCSGSVTAVADTELSYSGLLEGQEYAWSVRQVAPCADYSECRRFTTIAPVPGPVGLSGPTSGSVDAPTSGALTWSAVPNAVAYRVQLATACGSGVEQVVSGTSYNYSGLDTLATFYWRVAPVGACGGTPGYSACWTFATRASAGSDRVYFPNALSFARGESLAAVPVLAENLENLRRVEVNVRLDAQVFEYLGYTLAGTRSSNATSVSVSTTPNEVRLQIVYPPNEQCPPPFAPGSGEVVRLIVKVKRTAPLGGSTLEFGNANTRFRTCDGHSRDPEKFSSVAMIADGVTGVGPLEGATLLLSAPAPSPTLGPSRIRYFLPAATRVRLTVYDLVGREVTRLVEGEQVAGWHDATWSLLNSSGVRVSPGVYLVRLSAGAEMKSRRLLVVR